ncbi:MAG: Asp-tRNA(Asn)/Glu-tRNA(Gln) amidotransferase subunit GatA [Planctomycetota bacterium]
MELCDQTATALIRWLAEGQTTCVAVMEAALDRIGEREDEVHAFVSVRDRDALLAEAAAVDARRAAGEAVGALGGLPVAVKDNLCTRGTATTCGSKMLERFVPPYDATAVAKVRAADGIVVGKTNLDEFAMGSSTENSAFGVTRNPVDTERVPGGSSGGSAAAVAAGMCALALGSDTGGSIRQPASFCGVVGLKPTYGRVSRYGLVAYGSSLDQVGPITRSVDDAALLLGVIAGHDPRDATSLEEGVPAFEGEVPGAGALRIGVPAEYGGDGMDAAVRRTVDATVARLEALGHEAVPVSLPHTAYAIPTYYLIASAEASSNLARYAGYHYGHRTDAAVGSIDEMIARSRGEGFGDEVKRRIMLGTYALSAGYDAGVYDRALRVRRLIREDFDRAFAECDVIVHAVAPQPAFRLGEKADDPLAMYLGDVFSVTANLAGLPAASVPAGADEAGRPIGVQVVAPALAEARLVRAARAVESGRAGASQPESATGD